MFGLLAASCATRRRYPAAAGQRARHTARSRGRGPQRDLIHQQQQQAAAAAAAAAPGTGCASRVAAAPPDACLISGPYSYPAGSTVLLLQPTILGIEPAAAGLPTFHTAAPCERGPCERALRGRESPPPSPVVGGPWGSPALGCVGKGAGACAGLGGAGPPRVQNHGCLRLPACLPDRMLLLL